jgi:hypothetical protein
VLAQAPPPHIPDVLPASAAPLSEICVPASAREAPPAPPVGDPELPPLAERPPVPP